MESHNTKRKITVIYPYPQMYVFWSKTRPLEDELSFLFSKLFLQRTRFDDF